MFEHITKEFIKTHEFQCDGLFTEKEQVSASFRLKPGMPLPMSPAEKEKELRKKIVNLVVVRYDNNYRKIDAKCLVTESTLRKYIRGDKSRNITREMLAKLCVGTPLTLEETAELFMLQGYALDPDHNLLDAIVVDCIKCKHDIITFYDECIEFGLNVFKDTMKK